MHTDPIADYLTRIRNAIRAGHDEVEIPLNGRNFLALAQLSDAVVVPPGGTRGDALQQAGPLPNVGGQRSGHNIYLLDGNGNAESRLDLAQQRHHADRIEAGVDQRGLGAAVGAGQDLADDLGNRRDDV